MSAEEKTFIKVLLSLVIIQLVAVWFVGRGL